jgi:SAM-dependent methyltransferase
MPINTGQNAAFDATAEGYDQEFSNTVVGRMQRALVWDFLKTHIFPFFPNKNQKTALELNCGTGEDALWLAQNGWQIKATDLSPKMIGVTKQKAIEQGLDIRTQVMGFEQLPEVSEQFNLVFSNFGGLNCISKEEIANFGLDLHSKILEDGYFVAVVMGRFCWWETKYFLLKGNLKAAFRRFSKEPVQARLDATTFVATWYYSPASFLKALNQQLPKNQGFTLIKTEAIGCWLPPSYLDVFFKKIPFLLTFLNKIEKLCRGSFWAEGADHFLICLKKTKK